MNLLKDELEGLKKLDFYKFIKDQEDKTGWCSIPMKKWGDCKIGKFPIYKSVNWFSSEIFIEQAGSKEAIKANQLVLFDDLKRQHERAIFALKKSPSYQYSLEALKKESKHAISALKKSPSYQYSLEALKQESKRAFSVLVKNTPYQHTISQLAVSYRTVSTIADLNLGLNAISAIDFYQNIEAPNYISRYFAYVSALDRVNQYIDNINLILHQTNSAISVVDFDRIYSGFYLVKDRFDYLLYPPQNDKPSQKRQETKDHWNRGYWRKKIAEQNARKTSKRFEHITAEQNARKTSKRFEHIEERLKAIEAKFKPAKDESKPSQKTGTTKERKHPIGSFIRRHLDECISESSIDFFSQDIGISEKARELLSYCEKKEYCIVKGKGRGVKNIMISYNDGWNNSKWDGWKGAVRRAIKRATH